jgi:hypothetical protein
VQHVLGGQRGKPAEVDDSGADPPDGQPPADPQAHPQPVAERDDREIATLAVGAGPAQGHVRVRPRIRRQPATVAVVVQVAGVVQRDRLQEHAHRAVDGSRGHAGPQHRGGVIGPRRAGEDQAGDVAQRPDRIVVVEVAAEALLVRQPGHPHHHRVAELTGREELLGGSLAPDLIRGVVQIGQVLDLRHREQAGQPAAKGQPEDRLLVEQGVEDPGGPEPALQPLGHAVDAALAPHVLPEHAHAGFRVQKFGQRQVDRLGQRDRLSGHGLA